MADVKWIKITTDIFDDEKILLIESMPDADAVLVIWLKLLCLAGKQNNCGVFTMSNRIPYTDEMLATIMRRPVSTVRMSLAIFEQFGMIEVTDGVISIANWEKHQNIEGMERVRELNRLRKQRQREREKLALPESDVTSRDSHATDKNREEENRLDKKGKDAKRRRFVPPSLDEVAEYVKEKGYHVDPQGFMDHYTANGWKVGRSSMVDWKAAVRNWERRDNPKASKPDPNSGKKAHCPKCGENGRKFWRNTQTGKYYCERCRVSVPKGEVVWQ